MLINDYHAYCLSVRASYMHSIPLLFLQRQKRRSKRQILLNIHYLPVRINEIKKEVDHWIGKDVDVPFPKDPAGGYTHDKHKANYMLMFNSGILYNLTGDSKVCNTGKENVAEICSVKSNIKKSSAGYQQFTRPHILAGIE